MTSLKRMLQNAGPSIEELEAEIAKLPRPQRLPDTPAAMVRPLSPEAQELVSKQMIMSAEQAVREGIAAAERFRDDAERELAAMKRWGEVLLDETRKAAEHVAASHARMRKASEHFKLAIEATSKQFEAAQNVEAEPEAEIPNLNLRGEE